MTKSDHDDFELDREFWNEYSEHIGIKVTCPDCGEIFSESVLEITNISSDVYERDVLSFICPYCQKEVQGLRFI